MKLIFIYGPPAVGKLTVAKELSRLTGFPVLHNHLTIDLAEQFFDFGTKAFFELNDNIKKTVLAAAIRHRIQGLILTFVYAKPFDDRFVKEIVRMVKAKRGQVYFVRLSCDHKTLMIRVRGVSRHEFGKLKNVGRLRQAFQKWNFVSAIPFVKSLQINNTKISARKVALMIKDYYNL